MDDATEMIVFRLDSRQSLSFIERSFRPMNDRRRETGAAGEAIALAHYEARGYTLVERNARNRHGEIDLIVIRRGILVFAEVRTRVAGRGDPLESFGPAKARQVRRMASGWLAANRSGQLGRRPVPSDPGRINSIRLDAVAVTVEADGSLQSLEVLEGAL